MLIIAGDVFDVSNPSWLRSACLPVCEQGYNGESCFATGCCGGKSRFGSATGGSAAFVAGKCGRKLGVWCPKRQTFVR